MQSLLLKIPKGKVSTYKALAQAMGIPKGYRYMGQLLHKNPDPENYPCYKVVKSDGRLGGFVWGAEAKAQRLKKDGIEIKKGKIYDFEQKIYTFI